MKKNVPLFLSILFFVAVIVVFVVLYRNFLMNGAPVSDLQEPQKKLTGQTKETESCRVPDDFFDDFRTVSKTRLIERTQYFIRPDGDDNLDGLSLSTAFKTIQKAVDLAQPGDSINLAPGEYLQDVITKRDGQANAPITIQGPRNAIVRGNEEDRLIEINHDYITLNGFTLDGLKGDPGDEKSYHDKLVYAQGKEKKLGVTGLLVTNMSIKNAGGECIRLRYFAEKNEISKNEISDCGKYDFMFDAGGKNGEGVYIGTAPEQLKDKKNPTADRDLSQRNWIHDNVFNTNANECVDIKEGSTRNLVENNRCTGQKDSESGGIDSRGNDNIFRNNEIYGNLGAGIRLGGDKKNDGINNSICNNSIHDNQQGGISFLRYPQGRICGNTFSNNGREDYLGDKSAEIKKIEDNDTCLQ